MNILIITQGDDGGGVYMSHIQFISRIKSAGHKVYGVIIGEGKATNGYKHIFDHSIILKNINNSYSGGFYSRIKNIYKSSIYGKEQSKIIKKEFHDKKIDIVLLTRMTMIFTGGYFKNMFHNVPTFWYIHGTVNSNFARRYLNLILPYFKIIPIANSKYTQESIGKICKYVVYPGYEPNRVLNGTSVYRKLLNIKESSPVYGIAARICKEKAQDMVIKAFINSDAIDKHAAHLIIAGDYTDSIFFNKVILDAGNHFEENIHYIGRIEDLNNFYESVDITINGMIKTEAFGMSVVESLAVGKPVIANSIGGPSEMIEHNKNGWLVDITNEENYKIAINESLKQKDDWENMKSECIKSASRFKVESNVAKMIEVFELEMSNN